MKLIGGVPTPEKGDRVFIEHDSPQGPAKAWGTLETVLADGARGDIRLDSGPIIRSAFSFLGHGEAHTRHRATDRSTAIAAARSLTPQKLGKRKTTVLLALLAAGRHGLTDFEYECKPWWLKQTVAGPRRNELHKRDGLVESAGITRPSDTGHPAEVWRLTEAGYQIATSLRQRGAA